jgi:hypothetical protein
LLHPGTKEGAADQLTPPYALSDIKRHLFQKTSFTKGLLKRGALLLMLFTEKPEEG